MLIKSLLSICMSKRIGLKMSFKTVVVGHEKGPCHSCCGGCPWFCHKLGKWIDVWGGVGGGVGSVLKTQMSDLNCTKQKELTKSQWYPRDCYILAS